MDFSYLNGNGPNGSVCSAHSMNSLNRSQNFIQASPMSSNLSIPGSDIMRADYIPSHRHSAIIVPSYRPTPDYETVMRQMKRGVIQMDSQSQSLRNLNIGNTHAYNQPEDLVYSQPEIRERHPYTITYGPQGSGYNKPVAPSDQMNPNNAAQNKTAASAISHTVSTPELANMQLQSSQSYNTAHMLKNYLFRPPPPYPRPRPATSTPDLASHRHKYVSGSSPDLVTRKVQLSVKTFQEDSSPVVRQSLQEVSEPLMAVKHHTAVNKRHSLEVISNMVRGIEAMALKTLNAPLPRRNTLREQVQPEESVQMGHEVQQVPHYHHKKTFSDATMLIHSSESEEEEETQESVSRITALHENMEYSAQLQAALARIPNKPPPEYPGPRKSVSNGALRQDHVSISVAVARAKAMRPGPSKAISVSRTDQVAINGSSLGPSISEPDLTSVKERVKKEPVKERPVSEMFSIEDSIIEREIMMRVSAFLCCGGFLEISNHTGQLPYQKTVGLVNSRERVGGKLWICLKLGNVILSATYNLVLWAFKGADPMHCLGLSVSSAVAFWLLARPVSDLAEDATTLEAVLAGGGWEGMQPGMRRLMAKPPLMPASLQNLRAGRVWNVFAEMGGMLCFWH